MKKLIEVAIPLEAINAASAREKSIRHGHPSTLHLWWARRPLAACRAVLFAQLVDDPSSHPDQFPTQLEQEHERQRLFAIIEDLVKWENSTNEEVLDRARREIRRSCGGILPKIYDPFSGGGSIPLEAQRLGLPSYGSDLNPVAVMIGKGMIELPPKFKDNPPVHPGIKDRSFYRHAEGLAEDVKYYGQMMRSLAWERIGHLYPQLDLSAEYGGGKATAIAWIWARTVPSPDPAFAGVEVPITSSFVLSSKPGREVWIEPIVDRAKNSISYIIKRSGSKSEISSASAGTKAGRGANFKCLMSDTAITPDYVKRMGREGHMKQTLLAVVAEGPKGRAYVSPRKEYVDVAFSETPSWRPESTLPNDPRNFWTVEYGLNKFGDLFTDRQLIALNTFSSLAQELRVQIEADSVEAGLADDAIALRDDGRGAKAYSEAISVYLGFLVGQLANHCSTICGWNSPNQQMRSTFSRQSIPMTWDFAEVNVFSESSGSFHSLFTRMVQGFEVLGSSSQTANISQMDAQSVVYEEGSVISSDPPYYDNIGYADLSDFFFCWMKPIMRSVYPALFSLIATPKAEELVATPYRHGGREAAEAFFSKGMSRSIANMAAQTSSEFPATIYYAFKQSEIEQEGISSTGWATFVQSVIDAGYSVVGTWPLRTEKPGRMIAVGTNALANSVVLVCRKKEASAEVITRAEFIRSLKRELPPAIAELQAANIAPADMPQSAIGPGMGVFSRYKAVLESDDQAMSVKAALQLINRELSEYLDGISGEFDADTGFTIKWFELHGMKPGDYGTANMIAQAKGIAVESVKHAGIVESMAGKVRILSRDELDPEWQPEDDKHLTIWECCQHLLRQHEKSGIGYETAVILKKIGSKADGVRDLAYVLYNICEKRGDAKEATSYNALIADWTDLTREAAAAPLSMKSGQMKFDV
jgi:putative DNA methylase